jgi:hypothetical protein
MLYIDELENYIKHFPTIYAWKSESGELDYSSKLVYYNVEPMLESARDSNVFMKFIQTLEVFNILTKKK